MKKQVFQWALFFSMIGLFTTSAYSAELSNDLTKQAIGNCHATYFPAEGKLIIPCVDVIDAVGDVQNYEAVLEQLTTEDSLQFTLREWSATDLDAAATEEALSCHATYFSEEGRLLMPCVDVVDSLGNVESHQQVVMEQSSSTLVELPAWTVTSVDDGIEAEEPHARSTRESSAVCTSGSVNVNSISTSCINGSCSTSGVKIACNSNSCQWCNASNQCGKILYNGVTSITGGSISCTNGKCTYSVKNGGSSSSGNFSCQSNQTQPTVTKPNSPASISATALSSSSIKLTWSDSSNNETGFYIYRWNGAKWIKIASVGANVTSYTNTGLQANTTYYYYVAPYNSSGENPSANASATTQKTSTVVGTALSITVSGQLNNITIRQTSGTGDSGKYTVSGMYQDKTFYLPSGKKATVNISGQKNKVYISSSIYGNVTVYQSGQLNEVIKIQ